MWCIADPEDSESNVWNLKYPAVSPEINGIARDVGQTLRRASTRGIMEGSELIMTCLSALPENPYVSGNSVVSGRETLKRFNPTLTAPTIPPMVNDVVPGVDEF